MLIQSIFYLFCRFNSVIYDACYSWRHL